MSSVQSVEYSPLLAKWVITLDSPAIETDSFAITVSHSSGFSGYLPQAQGAFVVSSKTSPGSNYVVFTSGSTIGDVFSPTGYVSYVGTTSFTISLPSGAAPPQSGTITLTVGGVLGTWSYNTTPTTDPTPGSADQATTNFPFDYSNHLNRIITALDQLVVVGASIANSLNSIATLSNDGNSLISSIAESQMTIADKQTTIANKQTLIETYQKKLKELGEGNGIHMVGAYDVFGMLSIYRLLIEQAKVLENPGTPATPAQITAALAEVTRVSQLIKSNIPRDF